MSLHNLDTARGTGSQRVFLTAEYIVTLTVPANQDRSKGLVPAVVPVSVAPARCPHSTTESPTLDLFGKEEESELRCRTALCNQTLHHDNLNYLGEHLNLEELPFWTFWDDFHLGECSTLSRTCMLSGLEQ